MAGFENRVRSLGGCVVRAAGGRGDSNASSSQSRAIPEEYAADLLVGCMQKTTDRRSPLFPGQPARASMKVAAIGAATDPPAPPASTTTAKARSSQ